jgi:hypothetical protein
VRRRPEPVALVLGLTTVGMGVVALTGGVDALVDARAWVAPVALVSLGAGGLLATAGSGRRRPADPDDETGTSS